VTRIWTCPSTHGGGGYAVGSYWDGDVIVCGICGYRIENPPPTGGHYVYDNATFWPNPLRWLHDVVFGGRMREVPHWPSFIGWRKPDAS